MKFVLLAIVACCATAALVGCSNGGAAPPVTRTDVGRAVPPTGSLSSLSVTVATDKAAYKTGDAIQITVSVKNTAAADRVLAYPSAADIIKWGYIIAQNGKIVTYEYWTGHHITFVQGIGQYTYRAGQTAAFAYTFPLQLPAGDPDTVLKLAPGTYQVYAAMPALVYDGASAVRQAMATPSSAPVTITVTN